MTRFAPIATVTIAALLTAACGSEPAPAPKAEDAVAASLTAGLYEITQTIDALSSTDNTAPKTALKVGDVNVVKTCFDGKEFAGEAFADQGDDCETKSNYLRNGRMSVQLSCTRKGAPGQIVPAIDGDFKADSFTATGTTMTYFQGPGDYQLSRKLVGKRTGDCSAAADPAPADAAAKPAA